MEQRFGARIGVLGGLVVVAVLGGCTPKALTGEPVDLYAVQGGLRQRPAPDLGPAGPPLGPETPYVPVMKPPRVQRAWTPAYVNDTGDLVSGHWVYLLLKPSRWFLDDESPWSEETLKLDAPPELEVRPPHHVLRVGPDRLGGGGELAVIPDRGKPKR